MKQNQKPDWKIKPTNINELKTFLKTYPNLVIYNEEQSRYEARRFLQTKQNVLYFTKNNGEITRIGINTANIVFMQDSFIVSGNAVYKYQRRKSK